MNYCIQGHWEPRQGWWMWHLQLWKGKLRSLWVQGRAEERRVSSPALPSLQGPGVLPVLEQKCRKLPRERIACGWCVPISAPVLHVLRLAASPHFPSSLHGCHVPSTFRCWSVLAHFYSPPILLAQPGLKRGCLVKVPGRPSRSAGW